MDEAQAGIKIAGRKISNQRYADDSTLMAKSKEELKSLLMKDELGERWPRQVFEGSMEEDIKLCLSRITSSEFYVMGD